MGTGANLDLGVVGSFVSSANSFEKFTGNLQLKTRRHSVENDHDLASKSITNSFKKATNCSRFQRKDEQYLLRNVGSLTMLINCPLEDGRDLVCSQFNEVETILNAILGPPDNWRPKSSQFVGLHDIVCSILTKSETCPVRLLGGLVYMSLSQDTHDKLDQLMGSMENDEFTFGSLILLEDSIMHSRLSTEETYVAAMLMQHRPMNKYSKYREIPVFSDGEWKKCFATQTKWYTVVLLVSMDSNLGSVMNKMEYFEPKLEEKVHLWGLPLLPTIHDINDFAGLDVIAYIHRDTTTGKVFAPILRNGPLVSSHRAILWWFLRRSKDLLEDFGLDELHLVKSGYRCYAIKNDKHENFLLCASQMTEADILSEYKRLLDLVK